MTDRDWLAGLKVGDPVEIHWILKDEIPRLLSAIVTRLLVREIEVAEDAKQGNGRCGFRKTYKFRKSDGLRWPLNAYKHELWRIEKP